MSEKKYRGYTIKVSLDKKCYRCLTFPGSFTLDVLAQMILDSFDFDNDHLHAFFMDGKPYGDDSYYSCYSDDPGTHTDEITVEALSLKEKQKFLFLFDFGDEWHFTCEVKKITDTPVIKPYISDIVGKAPEQYPDYDESDDDLFDGDYSEKIMCDEEQDINPYFPIESELYKAAFEFKAAKPWTKIFESEFFAIKFSDGEIGYALINGHLKKSYGMILYIGSDAVPRPDDLEFDFGESEPDLVDLFYFKLQQNCVVMTFRCKSEIEPEYVSEIQKFTAENGITLRGKNSFPYFVRYLPQRPPWSVSDEKDHKYMRQALEAATALAKHLENNPKNELRFGEMPVMPIIKRTKNGFSFGTAKLPDLPPKKYEPLRSQVEFKKFKSKVDLECKIFNFPISVYNEDLGCPEHPAITMIGKSKADLTNDDIMFTEPFPHMDDISEEMLVSFVAQLNAKKIFPKSITVDSERTKALLSDICERCGVTLTVKKPLPVLDEVFRNLIIDML